MQILNFGSCNVDIVYDVEHITQPGETIVAERLSKFPGGKGLNQAIAISKAGTDVYMAACVGEDDTMLRPILIQAGVDVSNVLSVKESTGQAIIQVDKKGENSIIIYRGANGAISKEYIDEVLNKFKADDILVLQNEISNLFYLIDQADLKGMRIILNPSPFESVLKEIDLRKLYCLLLNETEAMQWSGSSNPYDFLIWVKKEYPHLGVVLTLGEKGCVYLQNNKFYRQQAYKVNTVDTTAAGDTFTGYFISGICKGLVINEILNRASAAAAIAVSRKGAASSIPTYHEVEEWMCESKLNVVDCLQEQKEIVGNFLESHISDIKIEDIAMLLGYSEDHTIRWIQKHFGMSFSELLQRKRCLLAAEYLRTTEKTVDEIINEVGYSNGTFFRKKFYEYYQMTPKEYRTAVKDNL